MSGIVDDEGVRHEPTGYDTGECVCGWRSELPLPEGMEPIDAVRGHIVQRLGGWYTPPLPDEEVYRLFREDQAEGDEGQ